MGVDLDKLRREFDTPAFCEVYFRRVGLPKQEVEHFLFETLQIQQMNIPGLAWFPVSHLISTCPDIPLPVHYEALAAAHDQPYEGIEAFYRRMIEDDLLPAWMLNRTHFHRPPTERLRVGELMCELGLISDHTLQRCLGIQRLIREKKGLRPALATIISVVDCVSVTDFFQALGIQYKIPFRNLDESAPAIFEMTKSALTGSSR